VRTIGIIPARMAASRFPGKPLHSILGRPMIEHVYRRARMYEGWNTLAIATCDREIQQFAKARAIPVIMTGVHHTRALDRVTEAVGGLEETAAEGDIVVCVQGDEPMMRPDMIDAVIAPMLANQSIACTVLAMHITEESLWLNPDTVKIIHNTHGEVLYTTRTPVPYCKGKFSPATMVRRIYGIFAFRWGYLKAFSAHAQTYLEQVESCDSNRILDMPFRQHIAPYPHIDSFSVDSLNDVALVEKHMPSDGIWARYK
jgi:3-deoxy-manno-octulosonate cytidylyltransferase (CMP-KDO synthetase)